MTFELDFDRFEQTLSSQFNYRVSLTPVQKQAMKGDLESLKLIRPFLIAMLESNEVQILLSPSAIPAVETAGFNLARFKAELAAYKALLTAHEHAEAFSDSFNRDMHYEITRLANHKLDKRIPLRLDLQLFPNSIAIHHKHELATFVESDGYPQSSHPLTLAAIDYLLILDLIQIIHFPVGRGNKTPRFLPYYPTREIVRAMTRRYSQAIRFCSILELDSIDFTAFTTADFLNAMHQKGFK